ncbi:hypothetical protein AQ621_16550 (plasmid) [Marinobacter sp. P4B1]|nr:hypothetical protein AQ621_16550 [Marinobacter sp. P4B1]
MSKYDDPVLYYQDQIDLWESELQQETDDAKRDVCIQLRDEAAAMNARYQRIQYKFLEQGVGLTLKSRSAYCVVLEDAAEPGRYRYQVFNESGFIGHLTRDTAEEVLLEAFRDGFRDIASGDVLAEFCGTAEWERGTLVNDLVRRVNQGELSHKDAGELYEREALSA